MTFSKKIFVSVFFTALILGSLVIWTSHRYVSQQTEEKFISRYSVFTKVLSNTLTHLDTSTEALMLNAVKVIEAKDATRGLLSTATLKSMRDELSVTHIFVIDKSGKFIRSTNEDPELIPNAYSFCPAYKNMVTGSSTVEATPIIHPNPEPKPYKFLYVPSQDRQRLLEVGVRIDFIAKTLTEALGSDENVDSMSLYDPHGTILGRFNSKEVDFKSGTVTLPTEFPNLVETSDSFHFFTKVTSSHPRCCQCDVSKTSKNGEYYYVLEAKVSKNELKAVLASTNTIFLLLGFGNFILALFFSRFLSRRLVRNIEKAALKVREIQTHGDLTGRIGLKGKDEVSFLTDEFDNLLDKLEVSQKQLIESEKVEAKVQLAREVAHNIKSPVLALEMMLPMLSTLPTRLQSVLKNSVQEIKGLTERLRSQADSLANKSPNSHSENELLFLPSVLQAIINCKTQEFTGRKITIDLKGTQATNNGFIKGNSLEFKSIVSNLINNAAESYDDDGGSIEVGLVVRGSQYVISIRDFGVGIPKEYLKDLGTKIITFKGGCERGLGLVHAYNVISQWGGKVTIQSELGQGTYVEMTLPKYVENKIPKSTVASL